MNNKALVVIDIQNDITKHYRDIIDNINAAIEWAVAEGMHVVYIKHNNITAATRTFKPGTKTPWGFSPATTKQLWISTRRHSDSPPIGMASSPTWR